MKSLKLAECCSFYSGGTPAKGRTEYWSGDIPWFSPKDLKSFDLSSSQDRITELAITESATRLVAPGTILVVTRSGVLAHTIPVGIVHQPSTFNQDIKAIVPGDAYDSEYIALYLKAQQPYILSQGVKRGPTVHSLLTGFLEAIEIPDISIIEQRKVAVHVQAQLAEVDKARQAAETQLTEVKALPARLLAQAFDL